MGEGEIRFEWFLGSRQLRDEALKTHGSFSKKERIVVLGECDGMSSFPFSRLYLFHLHRQADHVTRQLPSLRIALRRFGDPANCLRL